MRRLACLWIGICVAGSLISPPSAAGQNLLLNSDFDASLGLTGWTQLFGSWVLAADSGTCSLSDAAAGTSALATTSHYLAIQSTQCIQVDPGSTPALHLGALFSTPAQVFARLYLAYYSDGSCSAAAGFSTVVFGVGPVSEWTAILGEVPVPSGVQSVLVQADFNPAVAGLPQYTGSLDHFYLGVAPQIFVDGFETEGGSACRWSSVVGG